MSRSMWIHRAVFLVTHSGSEDCPRPGFQVTQQAIHPRVFRMRLDESRCDEIVAAGMSHRRPKLHFVGQARIDCFGLNRAAGIKLAPVPFGNAARRKFNTTTKTTLV